MRKYLAVLLSVAGAVCTAAPASPVSATQALQELQRLSDASTCQTSQQCLSIPVGAKACGGPEGYLGFSIDQRESARALAQRHAAARRAENAASEVRSNCRVVTDPGAQCIANRCVAPVGGALRSD